MALVETRLAQVDGVGWVSIIYDDTLAVGDDILNCDLISGRVFVEDGRTAKYRIARGGNTTWREGSITGPVDETVAAGGPVQKVEDLTGFMFGGDE